MLTPLYPVAGHALLTAAAQALDAEALAAQTLAAETALGALGTAYTGDAKDRATVAVARQVNLQVSERTEPTLQSESRGDRSWTWVVRNGVAVVVDTIALAIFQALASAAVVASPSTGDYAIVRSQR